MTPKQLAAHPESDLAAQRMIAQSEGREPFPNQTVHDMFREAREGFAGKRKEIYESGQLRKAREGASGGT